MAISKEQVEHVAKLSRLAFNTDEIEVITSQLEEIIDMVEQLEEVETVGVAVTTNVIHNTNCYREDVATQPESRDQLMKNVPVHEDGYIKVPAMLSNGEGEA